MTSHPTEGDSPAGHTPGPWEARSVGLGPARVYACGKGGALIATPGYLRDNAQQEANAYLIAAAPALLAALRTLMGPIYSMPANVDAAKAARAAIHLATKGDTQ